MSLIKTIKRIVSISPSRTIANIYGEYRSRKDAKEIVRKYGKPPVKPMFEPPQTLSVYKMLRENYPLIANAEYIIANRKTLLKKNAEAAKAVFGENETNLKELGGEGEVLRELKQLRILSQVAAVLEKNYYLNEFLKGNPEKVYDPMVGDVLFAETTRTGLAKNIFGRSTKWRKWTKEEKKKMIAAVRKNYEDMEKTFQDYGGFEKANELLKKYKGLLEAIQKNIPSISTHFAK